MTHKNVDFHVPVLARVEGEGAMHVKVADGEVTDIRLEIYEPPRFFEAFLRGRHFSEPVDITARICGICPVAYQMSASMRWSASQASRSGVHYVSFAASSIAASGSRVTFSTSVSSTLQISWVITPASPSPPTTRRWWSGSFN